MNVKDYLDYLDNRVQNYEKALTKIENAIEECTVNDLWDIIHHLEVSRNMLIDLIIKDKEKLKEVNK